MPGPRHPKRKKRRSPLPAAYLLVAIIIVEIVGRLAGSPVWPQNSTFIEAPEWNYPHVIERDADLFWRYRPNQTIAGDFFAPGRYGMNSHGFRGDDFIMAKQDGTQRVVCFGGSVTFGWGVADPETYPRQLERRLNELDPERRSWQVINAGVTNYSSHQGLALAEKLLPSLDADIALFHFSWGDHQHAGNGVPDKELRMPARWVLRLENIAMRSFAFRWMRRGWMALFPSEPPKPDPAFRTWRVSMVDFTANIEKMIRLAKGLGARPVIVSSPISWPPPGMSDTSGIFHYHHRYHRTARYAAAAAGGEYAELANAFNRHPRFFDDPRRDNEHFNANGHAFAGDFLARFLLGVPQDTLTGVRQGLPEKRDSPD